MAFALVKKIQSVLRIPAVYAADDPEADAGVKATAETGVDAEPNMIEKDATEIGRRSNIKSLDELLAAEVLSEAENPTAEPTTEVSPAADELPPEPEPAPTEPAPAEPDAPEPMPTVPESEIRPPVTEPAPAEPEPAPADAADELPPTPEASPEAEPDTPEIPPEPEPAPADAADEITPEAEPDALEIPPEPEPAPADAADELPPAPEASPEAEPGAPEIPAEPEPAPADAADELPPEPEASPEAEPDTPEIPAELESAPADAADELPPAGADKDRQKLNAKALRFANGRTGLIGLMRRLRDVALIAAALAAGIFVRPQKSALKRKAKKLDVSENVERALSGDETPSAADATDDAQGVSDLVESGEQPVSAQASAGKKKPPRPSVKKATIKTGSAGDSGEVIPEAPPLDKAAAKKTKEKEKAAAKKLKDSEKKAAKKAKDEAKKAAKVAKEEAAKAVKEAKEAAFAEKNPKKAAKRAEQAAKKAAKKAAKDAKKSAKPDKTAGKSAKAAAKAAKKAKKEENKKPKLTKEEKFQLKLEKQAAKHEKKIEKFERKAIRIEQKLEKKHQKRELVQGRKNEEKAVKKEQGRLRKERKREIKKQRKYWLKKGVGRAKRNASVILLAIVILAALTTSTTFLYKSERVNIPILNKAVEAVIYSPVVVSAVKILDKPVHIAMQYAAIPVFHVIQLIQGEPKAEEMYFFEADKMERYTAFREANPDMPVDEVVWRVNAGVDLNLYQNTVKITDFSKKPILVNKFHSLPKEYEPQGMTQMPDNVLMRADSEAAAAFERLRETAASENLNITVASAYRSYEYQNLIYNPNVSDTRERLDNFLARPGFSENQSGLAFDLSVADGRMYDFAGTPEAVWVAAHAEEFGFILRYPADAEDVTGVRYQPWHIRYVGDEVVKTMRENDIETLEEYCVKFVDHKPGDTPEKPIEKDDSSMTEGTDGPI